MATTQSTNDHNTRPLEQDDTHSSTATMTSISEKERKGYNPDPDVEHGFPVIDPTEDEDEKPSRIDTRDDDPNIVDWATPDDPEKALNWTTKKKWTNAGIISFITLLTPLASSILAPAVPLIMKDFGETSATVGSLIVSIYVLGYAVGPLFLAPLSEVYGRLPVYHVCNFLFIVWTVACAVAPSVGPLMVFRLFAGIAGSCPITIGAGTIADLFIQEQRGGAMALFAMGPILGPVIGPVAGGYLGEAAGWRWVFWLVVITAGVVFPVSVVFLRETYEPVLLQRRTERLRKETGNQELRSRLDKQMSMRQYFWQAIVRPSKMLIFSPIVLTMSLYMAVVYGYLYLLFTTITEVFETTYGFSQGSVGLAYLGMGVGSLLGIVIFGIASDRIVKKMSAKGEMKPEYRLPPLIPGSLIIPIGLFWYGWSAKAGIHWMMPIIGTSFVGLGMLACFMPIQTYLVDAYTVHAASAIAASTVMRSLAGAFLPLAGPSMYDALGLGWGNSTLGFIAMVMAPVSFLLYKYGETIRKHPRFQARF